MAEAVVTEPAAEPAAGAREFVDTVYDAVKQAIGARRVTAASAVIMVTAAMAAVEKNRGLSGPLKKELALHVVGRLVGEIPAGQEDRAALAAAVALLGPALVDALAAAAKGQIGVNGGGAPPPGDCLGGCLGVCLGGCCRR